MVQDRWQDPIDLEDMAERAYKNLRAHFANFSAYLLPLLEENKLDSYISVSSSWCNVCGKDLVHSGNQCQTLPRHITATFAMEATSNYAASVMIREYDVKNQDMDSKVR